MLALESIGKHAEIINADPLPARYAFLSGADKIKVYPDGSDGKFDAAIVLDAGTPKRLRLVQNMLKDGMEILNIDHHVSNTNFGTIQIVAPELSSTAEILFELFKEWGIKITPEIASNLYAGVFTDTGRFSFNNTNARCLRMAAELVEYGADPHQLYKKIYQEQPIGILRLIERSIRSLKMSKDGRYAWIELLPKDFAETGTMPVDTESFAEMPRSVKGVEVGLFFRTEGEKNFKGSLRSNTGFNCSKFAAKFDGGGHRQAAGFTIREDTETARRMILDEIGRNFNKYIEE
jgi:phosphoesterase RecJ-like protein